MWDSTQSILLCIRYSFTSPITHLTRVCPSAGKNPLHTRIYEVVNVVRLPVLYNNSRKSRSVVAAGNPRQGPTFFPSIINLLPSSCSDFSLISIPSLDLSVPLLAPTSFLNRCWETSIFLTACPKHVWQLWILSLLVCEHVFFLLVYKVHEKRWRSS